MARRLRLDRPYDLGSTLGPLGHSRRDPTTQLDGGFWRATRTPEGAGTVHVLHDGDELVVDAWGPGRDWILEHAQDLTGAWDQRQGFEPNHHPKVRDLARRFPGVRLPRGWPVTELLVSITLFQLVTWMEGARAWKGVVERWGEPAPGPRDLLLPPHPDVLKRVPYFELVPMGALRKQAETIQRVCHRWRRMEEARTMSTEDASRRLQALRGIGPWTAHSAMVRGLGHPDAVVTGDVHLPNLVAWVLAREERADDARMLELLEPWRGHRGRVIGLLMRSGWEAPRRGPRYAPRPLPRG